MRPPGGTFQTLFIRFYRRSWTTHNFQRGPTLSPDPMAPTPGMRAVVTALTVTGAALSVPHVSSIGPLGAPPATERKHAAYLSIVINIATQNRAATEKTESLTAHAHSSCLPKSSTR